MFAKYVPILLVLVAVIIIFLIFKKKYSVKVRFIDRKIKFIINRKEHHTNNKIIITENGKQKLAKKIKGLEINFYGDNNTLICPKSCKFSDCVIHFSGSNVNFEFGEDCSIVQMKAIVGGGQTGNTIYIGKGFVNSGILQIFAGAEEGGDQHTVHRSY